MSSAAAAPTTARAGRRQRLRRWGPLIALAAGILAVALVGGPPPDEGLPLDPRSSAATGTKALVDVLRELGADVRIDISPPPEDGVALLLLDDLTDVRREQLRLWVRGGGTLVLADAHSLLAPRVIGFTDFGPVAGSMARACDLAALDSVERVLAPDSAVLEAPADAAACFPRAGGHWLVVIPDGDGTLVALGGPEAFLNVNLGEADNGLLAAALLAPDPAGEVTILRPALPGEGDATLLELISPSVRLALVQLGIAFALFAAWRARRLGRPVAEPQPVAIPGSELVVAVGSLLHQTAARARAAQLLRASLRRSLAMRLGLPAHTSPAAVADAVAASSEVPARQVHALLAGDDPADDPALVRIAQEAERIRRRALDASGAAPGSPSGAALPASSEREGAPVVH